MIPSHSIGSDEHDLRTMCSTMPIVTRSGKVLQTVDDPNALSKWFNPDRVTKPSKDDDDRTAIALFVVDEMPLEVFSFETFKGKDHADYNSKDGQKSHRRQS